jgi:phage terminase Nu1 subunit (DNA packaging protein)
MLLGVHEFASLFRVTPKTVNVWIANGMPVVRRGQQGRGRKSSIDLQAAVTWYFRANAESLELDRAKARLARAQADRLEMALAERRAELLDAAALEREIAKRTHVASAKLRAIAPRLASRLTNIAEVVVISARISAEVDAVLEQLAGGGK